MSSKMCGAVAPEYKDTTNVYMNKWTKFGGDN